MVDKEIYYHVGTGKTGSTFLQYRVFPKFKGINYIQRTKHKNFEEIVKKSSNQKILLSSEFDQQLEEEIRKFSSEFPNTTPIIVFRRQDDYIASQYRRFVKNGFSGGFKRFFDLENDLGFFKKKDLDYLYQIQLLEKYFNKKPIVLFYKDLRDNPILFIEKFSKILNVSIAIEEVDLNKKHTSYSEKQLKFILFLGKFIAMEKRRVFENNILHFFWRIFMGSIRYPTLYLGKVIPSQFFSNNPLIKAEELDKVKSYYAENWNACLKWGIS